MAGPDHCEVVREFFELFKTPWEFWRPDGRYQTVLCAGGAVAPPSATGLIVTYGAESMTPGPGTKTPLEAPPVSSMLMYRGGRLPIYGRSVALWDEDILGLIEETSGRAVACVQKTDQQVRVRIGYDLFHEVRVLLTVGQPPAQAAHPTLERHIDLLRDVIVEYAGPLVEIPPVPAGHPFIACLTHDVDHASLRRHKWDRTMFGFVYRATVGSILNVWRGRASLGDLLTNWAAAARLPFVYAHLARDFWQEFDRYVDIEKGLVSTFFIIPFGGDPGSTDGGRAPAARAAGYGAGDVSGPLRRLAVAGREVGVHGIDAWRDGARGLSERSAVAGAAGVNVGGVRMHWLYRDAQSPAALEEGGFDYDSTMGYNDTVGYRAGTTQAYKPLGARRLLELPLHVMDTALFYPRYLDLPREEARKRIGAIIDHAQRAGGAVTVNWHDRSIAPERLWGGAYVDLLGALKGADPWFSTAGRAIAWFRQRRSAVVEEVRIESGALRVRACATSGDCLPGLRLRVHPARAPLRYPAPAASTPRRYIDVGWSDHIDTRVVV